MVNNISQENAVRLPLRDGVSASRVQVPQGVQTSVLAFLCRQFPAIAEETWRSRLVRGLVLDAAGAPLQADSPCRSGDRLYYYRELPAEAVIPFMETVLYRDAHILLVDKPHFLPVIPSGRFVQQSLLVRLKKSTGIDTLSPIHRIDKDTAGLVLFSCNPSTRDDYQQLFRTRSVKKTYHAIAPCLPDQDWPLRYCSRLVEDAQFFRTQQVAGEANSETLIAAIAARDNRALYRLQPVTGRKHQLRVHLASLGIPIENDPLYPEVKPVAEGDYSRPLQLLAHSLEFIDPLDGRARVFTSRQQLVW